MMKAKMLRKVVPVLLLALLVGSVHGEVTFVNATVSNTAAVDGRDPWVGGRTPPIWRDRDAIDGKFGVFTADEDIYGGDDELGVNDYIMIKTTIDGLVPAQYYDVYLYFIGINDWAIMGGLSESMIKGFSRVSQVIGANNHIGADDSSGHVVDTGETIEGQSAYAIYRAYLGKAAANVFGEIAVYVDDPDNSDVSPVDLHRCWYDGVGFELTTPPAGVSFSPLPTGAVNKDEWSGLVSWTGPDVAADPCFVEVTGYDVYMYDVLTADVSDSDPNVSLLSLKSSNQTETSCPVFAEYGYTYFWRVDTHVIRDSNGLSNDIVEGAVWSFEVLPRDAAPILIVNGDLKTSLMFSPVAVLTGTVSDNGEDDIASVDWTVLNYDGGSAHTAMQMIDRTEQASLDALAEFTQTPEMLQDWIGTDTQTSAGGGDPMVLKLKNLPAGSYNWKSYHHDAQGQTGAFDVTVIDSTGSVAKTDIDISDANSFPVTTFENVITSDGFSDVILVFDHHDDQSLEVAELFFVMNGFELTGTGDSLMIDFSQTDGPVLSGYQGYFADHEVEASFTEQSFSAFGTTVSVLPGWNNYVVGASVTDTTNNVTSTLQLADFNTDTTGTYTVDFSVTDASAQTASKVVMITVYEDSCDLTQTLPDFEGFSDYDFNADCVVNMVDLAMFASDWLNDLRPSGQVE